MKNITNNIKISTVGISAIIGLLILSAERTNGNIDSLFFISKAVGGLFLFIAYKIGKGVDWPDNDDIEI